MVDPNTPLAAFYRRIGLDLDRRLPQWEFGGYEVLYRTEDGGVLCSDCANGDNGSMTTDPECMSDPHWRIVRQFVHWEGEDLECAHCGVALVAEYDSE